MHGKENMDAQVSKDPDDSLILPKGLPYPCSPLAVCHFS